MTVNWNPERVMGIVSAAFPAALAAGAGVAKTTAPHRTGELARGINFAVTGTLVGQLTASPGHAAPQEFGAGPHEILPVNKRALAGNGFGPVARVSHPGNPGVGYMQAGAAATVAALAQAVGAGL